jgi:hypothetical protein
MGLVNALGVCTYIEAGNHLSSGHQCTILDNLPPVVIVTQAICFCYSLLKVALVIIYL